MLENKRIQKLREFWISIAYFRASTVCCSCFQNLKIIEVQWIYTWNGFHVCCIMQCCMLSIVFPLAISKRLLWKARNSHVCRKEFENRLWIVHGKLWHSKSSFMIFNPCFWIFSVASWLPWPFCHVHFGSVDESALFLVEIWASETYRQPLRSKDTRKMKSAHPFHARLKKIDLCLQN